MDRTGILPTQHRRRSRVRRYAILTLCGASVALIYAQFPGLRIAETASAPEPRAHNKWIDSSCELADTNPNPIPNDLLLSGVLADSNPELGYALIGKSGSIALYKVGDIIHDRARLCAVYTDSVLLETDGTIHALHLTQNVNIEMDLPPSDESSDEAGAKYPERLIKLPAPGLFRDTMQYSELRIAGTLRAIQVSPGRDLQSLLRLGLWPGDLIIAVNGTPVELLSSAEHTLDLLGKATEGQVTIVRNGKRQDITLHREEEPIGPF